MANTTEDLLKQMYGANLDSQKTQLTDDYNTNVSNLDREQQLAKEATDKNIRLRKVEDQQTTMNNAEYYAAAGLSSGAKAQARLAQSNQLQADITALRTAQQATDAEAERQRSLLAKEYTSAIQKAQSENDLALANALYEEAKDADAELLTQQEKAASLMASAGDFSLYGPLYGLTEDQVAALNANYLAETGSTGTAVNTGNTGSTGSAGTSAATGSTVRNYDNGSVDAETVKKMQVFFGADADGKWGAKSTEAAGGMTADQALAYFKTFTPDSINQDIQEMKAKGISMSDQLAYLRKAQDVGLITNAQAAAMFNNHYKSTTK